MSAKHRRPGTSPRKSLKQSLKDLFLRRRQKTACPSVDTVGSGILRKGASSSSFDSSVYTLSLYESTYSLGIPDQYTISRAIPNRFQTPTKTSTSQNEARRSLLPATSLSQFDLHHAYLQQSTGPQRTVHQIISPTFTSLLSQEASIVTSSPSQGISTLKLQDSCHSLVYQDSSRGLSRPPSSVRTIRRSQGRGKQVSWLDSATTSSMSVPDHAPVKPLPADVEGLAGVRQVEHFKSFCVLDTAMPGCPVVATSQELRYIFEIGEHFFLNSCECEGTSMDIVTGQDAAGDPVTHLVLFTPLVIPSSGRSRFMLASLIDVTRFIHDAASLPELEEVSNSSAVDSGPQTPSYMATPVDWGALPCKLSADDLLGGCLLPEDRDNQMKPSMGPTDDIWVHLAHEEKSRMSTARSTPRTTRGLGAPPRSSEMSHLSQTSCTVDEVLDEFMSSLQELYSDFFLLGKSPLDDTYYEICNVSPMLHAAKEYINGHLSRTGARGLAELSTRLAQGSPFQAQVKWGLEGRDKRLYCSPLYGHNSTTWICFLVDKKTPELW